MTNSTINIYIIDDHKVFLDAFKSFIEIQDGFLFKGYSDGLDTNIPEIISLNPEVVILDYFLQNKTGIEILKQLRNEKFLGKIIFLSMIKDPKIKNTILNYGGNGIVSKEIEGHLLLQEIKRLINKEIQFIEIPKLLSNTKTEQYFLTPKEILVCKLICSGISSEEISEKLFISIHTLHTHRRRILEKTESINFIQVCKKLYF